jgi:hypothetical protein
MQAAQVTGVVVAAGVGFYAGWRFRDWQQKRKALSNYQAAVDLVKDDVKELKAVFDKASAEVKKKSKAGYEQLLERFDTSITRPELLEALSRDMRSLIAEIVG